MRYDVIIGREFINNSNLRLIYYKDNFAFEPIDDFRQTAQAILTINAIEIRESRDIIVENLDKDLAVEDQQKLLNIFDEVDNLKVEKVRDNHSVQVYLRDGSLFKYAPRRMSFCEKAELQKIIDDLLARSIIRPSISSYCARVVLVTKRNGKKRMCVDLRPLNQRIHPQKYPFPIIEDQINWGIKRFLPN